MSGRAYKLCGYPGGCINLVRGQKYCPEHTMIWEDTHSVGSTRKERILRQQVLDEEPWCRDCGVARSTEAGHIIPRARGGRYVRSNLKGQCHPCNVKQIQQDKLPLNNDWTYG
jgi:5-methylcytosine-specific restriction endonuclease McrA